MSRETLREGARAEAAAGERPVKTPARTRPLDESERGPWFEGPDVVTAIRVFDGELELELPRLALIALGASSRCELVVPGRDLSAVHCVLERKGDRLRVHDQHSTNGTFIGGRRIAVADLNPGDTFTPAPVTFLAMNDEMRAHRRAIADILGAGRGSATTPTPDQLLVDAVKSSHHFLLTGEPGSDLDRLARAIHAVSLRRARPLVELAEPPGDRARQRELMARAARSTLVLHLDAIRGPLDAAFCAAMFAAEHATRVIALAPSTRAAQRALTSERLEQMQHVWVRPLAMRAGEVLDLLDRMLVERDAPVRVADLAPRNRVALSNHAWRDNFAGLRVAADRIAAIARIPGWEQLDWRERAAALGVPKSTLHDWFTATDLALPLFASAAAPAPRRS